MARSSRALRSAASRTRSPRSREVLLHLPHAIASGRALRLPVVATAGLRMTITTTAVVRLEATALVATTIAAAARLHATTTTTDAVATLIRLARLRLRAHVGRQHRQTTTRRPVAAMPRIPMAHLPPVVHTRRTNTRMDMAASPTAARQALRHAEIEATAVTATSAVDTGNYLSFTSPVHIDECREQECRASAYTCKRFRSDIFRRHEGFEKSGETSQRVLVRLADVRDSDIEAWSITHS